jgi:hypothetical protein
VPGALLRAECDDRLPAFADGYRRTVERAGGSPWPWLRLALVGLVLAWILGPAELRNAVPVLVVFLVALGLEVHFLVGALRGGPARSPDRTPQQIDRDRYGFDVGDTGDPLDENEHVERWPQPGQRARPLRNFAVGVAIIGVLVVATLVFDGHSGWRSLSGERRGAAVERFSVEASRIAEKPVDVRCDEARDYVGAVQHADGVATVGGELAIVTPEVCFDLYRLSFEGQVVGSRTGRAVAVLAHEAWHLHGEADESVTECYALQSGVGLARRLGLGDERARQLMRQQLVENELRGIDSLDYRVGAECRDGGALDLDPVRTTFP